MFDFKVLNQYINTIEDVRKFVLKISRINSVTLENYF